MPGRSLYDEPTVDLHVRIPSSLHVALAARARRNGRAVSSELAQLLTVLFSSQTEARRAAIGEHLR